MLPCSPSVRRCRAKRFSPTNSASAKRSRRTSSSASSGPRKSAESWPRPRDPALAFGRTVRQPYFRHVRHPVQFHREIGGGLISGVRCKQQRIPDREFGLSHSALPLVQQPCERNQPIPHFRNLARLQVGAVHRAPVSLQRGKPIVQLFRFRSYPWKSGPTNSCGSCRHRPDARSEPRAFGTPNQCVVLSEGALTSVAVLQETSRTGEVTAEQRQQRGVASRHAPSLAGPGGGLKFERCVRV
jgi:hypothetical protein